MQEDDILPGGTQTPPARPRTVAAKMEAPRWDAPPAPASAPDPEADDLVGYDRQIETLKAAATSSAPETAAQKAARERRERSKRTIAAFVDGTSALANLFFTTQYAPNSYNPQNSQTGKVNGRIQAMKAERQADADRYTNLMLRLGDTYNARAKTLRDIRAQQEAQRLAREKARREEEAHGWEALLQPDKQREQRGKADKAGYEAESSRIKSENAPERLKLENDYIQAGIGQRKAAASASHASAENSRELARKHRAEAEYEYEYTGLGRNGVEKKYKSRQAAIDFERREGTYDPARWGDDAEIQTTVTENLDGSTKTTTQKKIYPAPEFNPDDYRRGESTEAPPLN